MTTDFRPNQICRPNPDHPYWVVFGRDTVEGVQINRAPDGKICGLMGTAATVEEAFELRLVGGDLVFHRPTLKIEQTHNWFWPWEKEKETKGPKSYAGQTRKQIWFYLQPVHSVALGLMGATRASGVWKKKDA